MKLNEKTLLGAGTIVSLALLFVFGGKEYNDTYSYFSAWDTLKSGDIDLLRTPLYPAFIGIIRDVFPVRYALVIAFLQYTLFVVSIHFFYRTALRFLNEKAAFWVAAFYAVYPTFNSWSNLLLTESLNLSLSVIFFYYALRVIMDNRIIDTLPFTLFLFLMLALRPSNVAFLPITTLILFLMLFSLQKKKVGATGLAGVLLCTVGVILYSSQVQRKTGVFTPSSVSVLNSYTLARAYGYLDANCTDNPDLSAVIRASQEEYGSVIKDISVLEDESLSIKGIPLADIHEVVSNSIALNPFGWVKGIFFRIYDASLMPAMTSYTSVCFRVHPIYPLNLGVVIIALICCMIGILVNLRKRVCIWGEVYMLGIVLSIIVTSIIGAQYEWNRLILPVIPLAIVLIVHFSGIGKSIGA